MSTHPDHPEHVGAGQTPTRQVTLIVPSWNSSADLRTSLGSIVMGTHMPERVIVVDDGSTDDTAAVAGSFSARLPVTVVRLPRNQGQAEARNVGLEMVTTPIVGFLDADDVLLLVAVRSVGGFRTEELRLADGRRGSTEDWDLWLRLVAAGERVTGLASPTVLYRVRESSQASDSSHMLASELHLLRRLETELPEVARAARRRIAHESAGLRLVGLQQRCHQEQRRLTWREAASLRDGGWRTLVRAIIAAIASPQFARRYLGTRGAW